MWDPPLLYHIVSNELQLSAPDRYYNLLTLLALVIKRHLESLKRQLTTYTSTPIARPAFHSR
jgi:hypothetical protein